MPEAESRRLLIPLNYIIGFLSCQSIFYPPTKRTGQGCILHERASGAPYLRRSSCSRRNGCWIKRIARKNRFSTHSGKSLPASSFHRKIRQRFAGFKRRFVPPQPPGSFRRGFSPSSENRGAVPSPAFSFWR